MKVFLDTNVIIDFYDQRAGFYQPAEQIMVLANNGEIDIVVSAVTFVNAFYVLRKSFDIQDLYNLFEKLSAMCLISPIDAKIIKDSLNLRRRDFEDSVQYYSAQTANIDVIITRNTQDYDDLGVKIQTPIEFLDDFFENKKNNGK